MAKATDVRPKITMACETVQRNYITKKNRRNDPATEVKVLRGNKHTLHKETR